MLAGGPNSASEKNAAACICAGCSAAQISWGEHICRFAYSALYHLSGDLLLLARNAAAAEEHQKQAGGASGVLSPSSNRGGGGGLGGGRRQRRLKHKSTAYSRRNCGARLRCSLHCAAAHRRPLAALRETAAARWYSRVRRKGVPSII